MVLTRILYTKTGNRHWRVIMNVDRDLEGLPWHGASRAVLWKQGKAVWKPHALYPCHPAIPGNIYHTHIGMALHSIKKIERQYFSKERQTIFKRYF